MQKHKIKVMHLMFILLGALQVLVFYYGNDFPLPSEVMKLCQSHNIQQMRLYNPNQAILQSLRGSNIHVMVGVPNPDIEHVASNLDNAKKWVQENVIEYWPDVRFRYIIVGNEDEMDGGVVSQIQYVAHAMTNLHQVIKVSTAFNYTNTFYDSLTRNDFGPIKSFLENNGTPMLVKVYPYHSYGSTPSLISLPYDPNHILQDEVKKLKKFYKRYGPLLDVLYSSLEKALEAGEGSLDLDKALETGEASLALEKALETGEGS